MRTKTFRTYDQDTLLLMPPSIRDWVDPESLPAFISDLVDDMDLAPFLAAHDEPRGMPPYHPAMMLKVLLYGYATGVRSSRKLEERLRSDVGFMFLAGGSRPGHKAIGEFRRRHLEAFGALFLDILLLCQEAGLVKLGRVALDGTKVKADASKHKAMSYGRMDEREAVLEAEVARILEEAEAVDAVEDARYGDARGDELPKALRTREGRLRAIREARAALEAEAKERTGDPEAVPEPKAQRNFTDPDSRIMLSKPDGFIYGYNAQAVVDEAHQIIVATELTTEATDTGALPDLVDGVETNTGRRPKRFLRTGRSTPTSRSAATSTPRHQHPRPGAASPGTSHVADAWPASSPRRRVVPTMRGGRSSSSRSSGRSRRPWASAGSACGARRR